jgi:hypothetical protein
VSLGEWVSLIGGILAILGVVSAFIYKLIRNELRDDLVPMITGNYTDLEEKIIKGDKDSKKYMATAFTEKLNEYEEHNEEIRTIRSEKYMGVIDNIKESIARVTAENQKNTDIILKGLDHIKEQINENSIKTAKIETRIDNIEKAKK